MIARQQFKFLALWIAVNPFGWLFGPLPSLAVWTYSLQEVARLLPVYVWQGLLLGLVIGAGQALVIQMVGGKAVSWFTATVIGYTLTFPAGLLLSVIIPWVTFRTRGIDFLAPGSGWSLSPFPGAIFFADFVIGAVQWVVLRPLLVRQDWQTVALWVFGIWASVGLSFWIGHWFTTIALQVAPAQALEFISYRLLTGAAIGIFSGALLLILIREGSRSTAIGSTRSMV
jgi:hypothetical protein